MINMKDLDARRSCQEGKNLFTHLFNQQSPSYSVVFSKMPKDHIIHFVTSSMRIGENNLPFFQCIPLDTKTTKRWVVADWLDKNYQEFLSNVVSRGL